MATPVVLISVDPGTELDVFRDIVKIREVVDIHLLFGEYDLIARVEADDYDAVGGSLGGGGQHQTDIWCHWDKDPSKDSVVGI